MAARPLKFKQRHGVQPDMNVTPLVDIVLVLLIIFMVVAPRMDQDLPVELPGIFNPDKDTKGVMDPLKVSIAKAGEFHVEEQVYDLDRVIALLTAEHELEPSRRLVLRADQRLKWVDVRPFMNRVQEVGFPGLSFLVGEKHRAGEAPAVEGEGAPVEDESARTAPAGALPTHG